VSQWAVAQFSHSEIGVVFGVVGGIVTFIGAYIYCIFTYGFFFGLGLGWLPSGILATVVGLSITFFWRPLLVIFAVGLIFAAIVVVK
jgi:hypothetical protein